jgi:1,4-alpha-glucan branching enzyme
MSIGTSWKTFRRDWRKQLWVLVFTIALPCLTQTVQPPLGATPQVGGTTFRLWAPFVESVAVRVNDGEPMPMAKEGGHSQADDTVWVVNVPGAKIGDRYKFLIKSNGVTREFIDPRARQLTNPEPGASSIIVDVSPPPSQPTEPAFSQMVIYELHIGTFNVPPGQATGTFETAIDKLDFLKDLGVNSVEVMPVHENARFTNHTPASFNWGYDPVQLYAVNSSYGGPQNLKRFVKACHDRKIAVILDVVYNHLVADNLLVSFGGANGPGFKDGIFFYGDSREDTGFGPRPDYGRAQVRAYVDDNALMWLREYGVDGLRWDSTINIRAFNNGNDPIREGGQLLRDANDDYRNTEPKQPNKISIAEDLQGLADLTAPTNTGGFGFNSQWDDSPFFDLRRAVLAVNDQDRSISSIKGSIERKIGGDAFGRVIYSENHDKVGHPNDPADGRPQIRLPALIDEGNHESVFAKKRSTLAAAVVLTSPGIPMIFQGQEMLDDRTFDFFKAAPMDWERLTRLKGLVAMYRDLIALRRNLARKTGGLISQNVNVFHVDEQNKTLAFHRFGDGGPGNDVIVVVNLSNRDFHPLNIGFPRSGKWIVRFNSGASIYDPEFKNGESFDTTTNPGQKDGLNFNADVGIGPYSVVILSQD